MTYRNQKRATSLTRRRHFREPERRFHIYCEGAKTEPAYFKALQDEFDRVQLEINPVGGDPQRVADKAIEHQQKNRRRRQSSFEESDQVWAVFDRDQHATYAAALDRCRTTGVRVASSDPCFELWLVLHFAMYDRPAASAEVQRQLHRLFPAYHHDKMPIRTSATFSRHWTTPRRERDGNFWPGATKKHCSATRRRPWSA